MEQVYRKTRVPEGECLKDETRGKTQLNRKEREEREENAKKILKEKPIALFGSLWFITKPMPSSEKNAPRRARVN
ncbi:MAG: hypothetical protein KAJ78_08925 [Acidobacteria bacterium]|nr:hypothetical protein [Acidobacteriota bacterium]